MRSSNTSGSLSSLPEEHVVVTARIILSSEIDVSRSGCGPTLERLSSLRSPIEDGLIIVLRGESPTSWSIAIWVAMGRRDGPELAPAEMAHAEATIAGSAKGRSLVISPVLARHTIGREALPPIIAITVAPRVETAVYTGATELGLSTNGQSLQSDLIWADLRPIAHIYQKNREGGVGGFFWARPIGSRQNGHGQMASGQFVRSQN